MRCHDCGGSHSSRRGGQPIDNITYGTWMNNCGNLFDNPTHADASWLSTGNYDVAFRGSSTPRNINIFVEGGYCSSSWKSTLITGAISTATTALGALLIGLFGRRRSTAVQQPQVNPIGSYWNNYFSNWRMPGITTGSVGGTARAGSVGGTASTGSTDGASGTGGVTPGQETTQAITATFSNSQVSTDNITGEVQNVKYDNSGKGFPISFEIHDSSLNTGNPPKKDSSGKPLANIYYFKLENNDQLSDKNIRPKYKCVGAKLYVRDKKKTTFTQNTFVIERDQFTSNDGKYTLNENFKGTTSSSTATVTSSGKIDFSQGIQESYKEVPGSQST